MNSINLQVTESVLAFSLVVLAIVLLKQASVISQEDGKLFARLLTQVVLPAMIFSQLAFLPVSSRQLLLVVVMIVSGVASLLVAWLIGRLLRLPRPKVGALMISSSFGSSAFIGYPMIQFAFPNNPQAMADAILVSELGVGLPIFTLCPLVAMHFGAAAEDGAGLWSTVRDYCLSPIFMAVLLGLVTSFLPIPQGTPFLAPFFAALHMISGTIAFLAALILGLELKFKSLHLMLPLLIASAAIQMGLQPALANWQAGLFHLTQEQRQVLVLISSMPSAVLGTVFATRYQCDSETTSALSFANIILGVLLVPLVFTLLTG